MEPKEKKPTKADNEPRKGAEQASLEQDEALAETLDNSDADPQEGLTREFEVIQKELLYLRAEFDNYKKRILREQEQAIRFANEKIIREFLVVVDHLERGVLHGKELSDKGQTTPKDFTNFVNGMEMTQRELTQLLNRFGVELIGSPGEPFDPAKHEAISEQEAAPEKRGSVLQVLQKGCLLNGRLLAPARVVVAK